MQSAGSSVWWRGWLLALMLLGSLALDVPARAADDAIDQALRDIERIEGLASAMSPGDKTAGRKYMGELNAIGTRLRTARDKSDPRLPAAVERFNALQKRVVDTANAPAAASPQAPAAAAPPATAAPRLTSSDQARFNRLGANIRSLGQRIDAADLQTLLDERRVAELRATLGNQRNELGGFPAEIPGVAEEVRNLDAVAAKLEARLADATAKGAALGDIEAQLAAIDARLQSEPMPGAEAFKPDAGADAAAAYVRTLLAIKMRSRADLATLERFAGAGIKDQRIDRLRHWAGNERQRQADESLRAAMQAAEARVQQGQQVVAFHAATDPAQADHRANRLLGEGRRAAVLAEFDSGLASVRLAQAIDAALERKDGPDRAAQAKALQDARAAYEAKYQVALAASRMPAAGLAEEKYLAIARAVLADPGTGAKPAKRLVINSKQVTRREKKEAEIRPGTVTTTATIYHWVWDEFQVATAEPVGDAHYLFYNTLKLFHSGGPTTPLNRWLLADRFQGERILPENIDK